ncbi:prolyl oligopeptidase family serine peptidase [Opitutus sp. GAS368]|uniref:S9 family peptidase n=1 Tax=Opitutus sp. GAS368 TaxID=1882749 RepID=UPI00087BC1F3|nr:prolyl oligopeptidase family serine peptidase [Opitutus sp. GAS368]SDR85336.1 Dipeptidyl aminopeptidase/acylaminoacyl peptidase [Opitutus sp. GAS368]
MRLSHILATIALVLAAEFPALAAEPARRPLSHRDFDGWRSITNEAISRDGRYLAYAYMPLEGDGEVIVRELATGREQRVPAGALPAPPLNGSEADPERPAPRRSVSISLTSDSRFAIAGVFPPQAETLAAKRAGKKAAELPSESLAIVTLATGEVTHLAGVQSHQIPANGGAWLAYLRTAAPGSAVANGPASKPQESKIGAELVLRDLAAATERVFPHVTEYVWARDGRTLVFLVSVGDESADGAYAVTPGDPAPPVTLATGPGRYVRFTWDRAQGQGIFLSDRGEAGAKRPGLSLYYWHRGSAGATAVLSAYSPGVPAGSVLSGDVTPAFSFDGRKLYVSTAPEPAAPDPRLAALLDEEKVSADLWRWNDEVIQPLQKVRAEQDRKRAYVGELDVESHAFRQLADPALATLAFNDDGSLAFGLDDRPYRARLDYDGAYSDLYLVNAATGARQLAVRALGEKAGVRWSPDNRWIAYYADRQWFALDARDGSVHPLSRSLPFAVFDENHDMPEMPGAYGTAGWTADGASLLIYDRFDLWQVFPDNRPARNLTGGFGREHRIQLRLQPIEANLPGAEPRGADLGRPLILRGEEEATRATGFYRFTSDGRTPPELLLWADKDYRYLGRALSADVLLLTASRFDEFPDILATDPAFAQPRKITDGGAQLAPFTWGSDELISYRSTDGVELTAMLCKPANFDPRKKYPMIVYIYERLSGNLHRFFSPTPSAVIDPSFYTSNGYLVLMPDIAYTTGHPGQSAYRCVMPAVDAVVRRGCVDENALGLEGHSWGGYETSYIITQTNRFRAAEAGAIVGNMTSAAAGIGESSGRSRQFKYEKNQSRLGVTLQDAPLLYLENSPVFFAQQVQTPLLILHNDHDDIVPWPQAVEFFLALRRAGKEAYLFNYNGEFHSPRRRVDQEDFARRMHQFFDHFLKGAPAPDWMTRGIPYLDRDAEKLRFRDTP